MSYKNLCEVCGDIQDKAENIFKLIEEGNYIEAQQITDKITQLGALASSMGQKMEKRLQKYRNGIEQLGFKRT
jgi:hypothetical protein